MVRDLSRSETIWTPADNLGVGYSIDATAAEFAIQEPEKQRSAINVIVPIGDLILVAYPLFISDALALRRWGRISIREKRVPIPQASDQHWCAELALSNAITDSPLMRTQWDDPCYSGLLTTSACGPAIRS